MFSPRKFQLFGSPTLTVNHNKIRFVDSVKYFGVYDIARQVRYRYCWVNKLKIDFIDAPEFSKTICFVFIVRNFVVLESTDYGVNIPKVRYIGVVLLMIITVFCRIFLNGSTLVYLKLNATSIHLMLFYAKLHIFLLFSVGVDLPIV